MKLSQEVKKLKQDLGPMTWKQRLDHLWTYYKSVLAVAAVVVMVICIVATSIYNKQFETVFGGTVVNIYLSEETERYLTEDIEELLQVQDKQQVVLDTASFGDLMNSSDPEGDSTTAMMAALKVAAKELDYAIMDKTALEYYIGTAVVSDLNLALTQEQLAMFEGRIIYAQLEENGETFPVALDITDTAFVQDCYIGERTVYITFPNNTEHDFTPSQFLDYLLAWKAEE